ncbi:long-chain-fatty-acid--CoA ligase [Streptacidiphilus jiangxiensis]|uniref:Long-chain acyl-CoA synthetase n=1 Tax=Streptacidiphilus jiangxiensis TaxID=235985 RepID=A0A1H7QJQ2_STRJI|nr:long-chain fatty acid--CoA ligase [Streptacidiphilus jiangxiensis]SEL48019.1 long-chain acyl-CoA synthetase [Streptacidiphilus jiangxiensis]
MTTLSLASVLAENARRRPGRVALVEGETRLTFGELWQQSLAQAAALVKLGVRPGDRVALMAPNVAEFPRAYYAILAAGGVVVPVHLLLTGEEVAYVLRDSGAGLLLAHAANAAVAAGAAAEAGVPLVTMGPEVGEVPGALGRLEDFAAADGAVPLAHFVTRQAEDPAVVFYTSGTTGQPKGAVLSHLNLVMNATVNAFDANHVEADDVVLGSLPLFHTFGQTVSMNSTWRAGAALVLLPRFHAGQAIELMLREGVNTFHGVPTMYIALLEAAKGSDGPLPKLRLCISGGASLPVPVLEKFNAAFEANVFEGYGLSETSPTASVNQPDLGTRPGTVGHPVWGVDVEIARAEIEESIELLPVGELGEVVVRGHNVFQGYLGRPEATEQALVDGWFRTGDLGVKDADGFISIVDRKKDVVIRGGFNVYPREVEETLLRHPAVAEAAVIGLPDDTHGEEVCAVLVLDPSYSPAPSAQDVIDWSKEHLAKHKYPRRVEFTDAYPLGPSHKVLKRELRARYR